MPTLKELNGWVVENECILFYCSCGHPNDSSTLIGLGPDDGATNECRKCGTKYEFKYTIEIVDKE